MARDTSPAVTLGAYGAGLVLVLVAALGLGRAVGPVGVVEPDDAHRGGQTGEQHGSTTGEHS